MTKRRLRLMLLGLLCIIFLLPMASDPKAPPIWMYSFWYSMETLAVILSPTIKPDIGDLISWVGALLYLLAIQILIVFSLCLCCSARLRKLERFYRVSLVVLFFVVWWFVLFIIDPYRGIGYWANPVMVTVAALMEIGFVIQERSRKPVNLNP